MSAAVASARVLILCTHNSARSQMAEGFVRAWAGARFQVASAGTEATRVHPLAIRAMDEVGIDIRGHASKALDRFIAEPWDYIITVCDQASERCPCFPVARRAFTGASRIHRQLQGRTRNAWPRFAACVTPSRRACASGWPSSQLDEGLVRTAPPARAPASLGRRAVAEALGTALLLSAVVGSGIMGAAWPAATSRSPCSPTRWLPAQRWWR